MEKTGATLSELYAVKRNAPPSTLLVSAAELLGHTGGALDLGAGAGADTRYLLDQGFDVTAVDREQEALAILKTQLPQEHLHLMDSSFEDLTLTEMYDLINASFALPFTTNGKFDDVFAHLTDHLKSGGIFTGQLFGVNDQLNVPGTPMTFHTKEQVESLFSGWEIIKFAERERDGTFANGNPKHWHLFHIIARKK